MCCDWFRCAAFVLAKFDRMLKQEKKDIRLAIMPLLQAEEDARYVKDVSFHFPYWFAIPVRCKVAGSQATWRD